MAYRGGKGAPPGRSAGRPTGRAEGPQRQSDYLVPMLPFIHKDRMIQEHKARNPHRRYFNDRITNVYADWADEEASALDRIHEYVTIDLAGNESVVQEPREAPEGDVVNVRLFLAQGISKPTGPATAGSQKCKHVMRRLDVVGAQLIDGGKSLVTYGGLLPRGDDASLIVGLVELVKAQSGLDLSAVVQWTKLGRIVYDGAPETVFLFPHLWGMGDLALKALVKQTEETYEEEEEVPVEPEADATMAEEEETAAENGKEKADTEGEAAAAEGAAEEADKTAEKAAPPPATKKVMVTKTRTKEEKVMIPTQLCMATLHEYTLSSNTNVNTIDLCTALDFFDEWVKYSFCTRMAQFLVVKNEEAKTKLEEYAKKQQEASEQRKVLQEETAALRSAKDEKIAALMADWEGDDVGKTDEDKKEAQVERNATLKQIESETREAIRALGTVQDPEHPGSGLPSRGARGAGQERVQEDYDLFQYFDRPAGLAHTNHLLPRDWLAQLLLCLDKDRTYGECIELVTVASVTLSKPLNYNTLTLSEKKEVEEKEVEEKVVEEKVVEEKEEQNGEENGEDGVEAADVDMPEEATPEPTATAEDTEDAPMEE